MVVTAVLGVRGIFRAREHARPRAVANRRKVGEGCGRIDSRTRVPRVADEVVRLVKKRKRSLLVDHSPPYVAAEMRDEGGAGQRLAAGAARRVHKQLERVVRAECEGGRGNEHRAGVEIEAVLLPDVAASAFDDGQGRVPRVPGEVNPCRRVRGVDRIRARVADAVEVKHERRTHVVPRLPRAKRALGGRHDKNRRRAERELQRFAFHNHYVSVHNLVVLSVKIKTSLIRFNVPGLSHANAF